MKQVGTQAPLQCVEVPVTNQEVWV